MLLPVKIYILLYIHLGLIFDEDILDSVATCKKISPSKIAVACFSLIHFSTHNLNSFCLKHFTLGCAMKNRYYQGFPIC